MQALRWHGRGDLRLEETPRPTADEPDQVVIEVEACGICGSDYEQYEGAQPPHEDYTPYPVIPGHEPLGVIEEIGARARQRWGVSEGDRVAVRSGYGCGQCEACRRWEPRACPKRGGTYGYTDVGKPPHLWGGYAEFMYLSPYSVVKKMDPTLPAGVAVMFSHGVRMFNNYFRKNWGDASYGILLKEISDSYIQGNRFEYNTSAIYMEGASRIMMERNSFNNNGWGLKIQASCMDITLQYNNFTGNSFDVGTNGSLVLNTFNHNYWDKYEGYDINKDGIGDVAYHPVSMYSMIVEQNPYTLMLFRSFATQLLDKAEKAIPGLTPVNLADNKPIMKSLKL